MPFTFSHPALIIPLTYLPRHWFSTTALVAGSLTPDFEYFMRMRINSQFSHTTAGVFWFDLPLGLLLVFVFHLLVRNALIDNLPGFIKARLYRFKNFEWLPYFRKHWLAVIISLIIGAGSHVFWDRFTHEHGYFVDLIPALNLHYPILGHHLLGYRIVQHASTLVGAVIIIIAGWQLPKDKTVKTTFNSAFWDTFVLVALPVFAARLLFRDGALIGNMVASFITACLLGLVVGALTYNYITAKK